MDEPIPGMGSRVRCEGVIEMKCSFPDGITVKPDGVHDLDPCEYELTERHRNVTVEVLRCRKCGHVEISWLRQDNTIDETGCDQ